MKTLFPSLLVMLSFCITKINAQCGVEDQATYITTQSQLEELAGCDAFIGELNITGTQITSLEPISTLLIVQGNLNIYETSITSLAPLESLMNAYDIAIYNNLNLDGCCPVLDWQSALDFGTIQSVQIYANAAGCNSFADAQAECLGLVPGCMDPNAVNFNPNATFEDGTCLNGPDLQVSVNTILNSLEINSFTSSDECLVAEGCITGTGERKTLRFTTTISNYGNEDFYIGQTGGVENLNPNFYWDDCHGHAHYEGYANYRLYDYPSLEPSETIGHKNGWCVMDLGGAVASEAPAGANYPACNFTYGCTTMGISAGCSDTYGSGISCQWVDVTGLADGEYVLAVSTNMETDNYEPQYEIDYSNNIVYVLFELETTSNETVVVAASEFDGSSITDVCSIDNTVTNTGFNFSDDLNISEDTVELSTAFLFEYYTESIQLLIPETITLNGTPISLDSLSINQVTGLPQGLQWACSTPSCALPQGYSCGGITGISEQSGDFSIELISTLFFTDQEGNAHTINLPYQGGNTLVDDLLGNDYSTFNPFTPNMILTVDIPSYGCMDTVAMNYDTAATFDDGSCEYYDYGCTDPFALNFDDSANTEDGSCEYCAEGIEWVVQMDLMDSYGDGWNGNYYYITNEWGDTTATGTLDDGSQETQLFCLMPGCYIINVPETGGWPYEISWAISSAGFPDVYASGACPDIVEFNFLSDTCNTVVGCTDSTALNYDNTALMDDGSCEYPVYGCTDIEALNYNNSASDDDGSCIYPIQCDSTSNSFTLYLHDSYGDGWNGNDFIVTDTAEGSSYETTMTTGSESVSDFCLSDGCFLITVNGGTWQEEITWELVNATGDTVMTGTAPFEANLSVNTSCENVVEGCTDSQALNYDAAADTDDGSCIYPLECGEGFNQVIMNLQTDPYPAETSWDLISETGDTLFAQNNFTLQNTVYIDSICVPNDQTITFNIYDTYGDGLTSGSGNGLFNLYVCGVQVFSGSSFEYLYSGQFYDCDGASIIVFGCTDEDAINYDDSANTDDGSCEYEVVMGCTDSTAVNYQQIATDDDGSCEYLECEFYEVLLEINMFSTNGNGWEGLNYSIQSIENDISFDGTFEDGFDGVDYVCVENGCYLLTVPEYQGNNNLNWSILLEGKKLISGTAGYKDIFGVNQECTLVSGCTDEMAYNYNPLANHNDGSCLYTGGGTQVLNLEVGWNLVSTYIQSSNMDMANIISPIISDVVIVKDYLGLAYLPDWNFNGIGDWNNTQGYQIKTTAANSLSFNGDYVLPEETSITIDAGWNTIAYLRDSGAPTDAVFESVVDDVVIVKDGYGLAYLPDWNFNGIGNMQPGQAYQVKMNSQRVLTFNANNVSYRMSLHTTVNNNTENVSCELVTDRNMHLLIPQESWDIGVIDGDEIYVYDTHGMMVGASKVTLPHTLITIWGDDQTSPFKDGLMVSEEWSMMIYSKLEGKTSHLELTNQVQEFVQDELIIATSIAYIDANKELTLFNSIPNPASTSTEISFYSNIDQNLSLELYNVLGKKVFDLADGQFAEGYHKTIIDISKLAPGSYIYKLSSEAKTITKRLEVIR